MAAWPKQLSFDRGVVHYLQIRYKPEKAWSDDDSKEKPALAELWAKRSGGSCLFVMPKGLELSAIEKAVRV
ncbi:hypothetical protein BIU88_12250 [Chlorobaculum limnaeum]|uniref:Uncharacterized protein n=1 Tax=Chlorobaculum limnaeum TaxID=274537 RepID=A0A1D8D2P9_CHLLM|nr:hypothetical protein BIU88_12250 [Chlorobaculum limnaeum]